MARTSSSNYRSSATVRSSSMSVVKPPSSKISVGNWLLAFFGLSLSLGGAYLSVVGAAELQEELAYDMIRDHIQGRLALDLRVHKTGYSEVTTEEADAAFEQLSKSIDSETVKSVADSVLQFVRLDPAVSHEDLYFGLTNQIENQLSSPDLKVSGRQILLQRERAQQAVSEFKLTQERLTIARNEQTETAKEEKRVFETFRLVADDFRDFMGFTGFKAERSDQTEIPNFYKSGVLENYPKLLGIPDGLKDLEELKLELSRAAVKPKVTGENAYQQFETKMNDIKKASLASRESYDAFLKRAENSENEVKQAFQSYKNSLVKCRHELSAFLEALLSPRTF